MDIEGGSRLERLNQQAFKSWATNDMASSSEKTRPQLAQEFTFPVASGWIAGESLMGVALVLWENGPELVRRLVRR